LEYLRIIPRLDIKSGNLIKGINLEGLRVLGDPNKFALEYYNQNADELLFMDVVATLYGRNNLEKTIREISKDIFIPITVGGGIRNIDDASRMFENGADKIALNTAVLNNNKLLEDLVKKFGSQNIIVSIEAKNISEKLWHAYTHNGREKTNINVIDWIKKINLIGAGEILLTSIDKEGMRKGFDVKLAQEASKSSKIPLIISGGMGSLEHLKDIVNMVDAICVADALHYKRYSIHDIKSFLDI
tara:strand:- start:2493 stop:3224 length:732 start_codon:yes stop_codon:yes gene_type:complete